MLINLFPYVDESKLRHNIKDECRVLRQWEDEFPALDPNNDLKVNECGLLTH